MIAGRLRTRQVVACSVVVLCLLLLSMASPGNSEQTGLAPQATQGSGKPAGSNDIVRRLQLERYRLLKEVVAHHTMMVEQGREDTAGLRDFTVAMFHAEADLVDSAAERMRACEKLVEFLSNHEKRLERMAAAGQIGAVEVSKARISSLDAQIELERQKLAQQPGR